MYVLLQSECCDVGCLMCRAVFAGYSRLSVLPIFSICLRISGMKGAGQLPGGQPSARILPHLGQIMQHHNTQHADINIRSGKPSQHSASNIKGVVAVAVGVGVDVVAAGN